ncbi:T9SS type A sorting domain-containing protein [Taibaiella soli]|nr:T9SS type A sorting domain-containing protein [Taibaiella soli]
MTLKTFTLSIAASLSLLSFGNSKTNAQALPIAWQKVIGCSGNETPRSFIVDDQGDYIVAGSASDSCEFTGPLTSLNSAWIIKLDSGGNKIWSAAPGGFGTHAFNKVRQTPDGGYIAVGFGAPGTAQDYDFWIVKFERNGNMLWEKYYGSSAADWASDVVATEDGFMIAGIAGHSGNVPDDGDVTGYKGLGSDGWVIKLDTLGNLLWEKTYGSSMSDGLTSILQTTDSNFVVTGTVSAMDSDVVTPLHGGNGAWLVKINPTGQILWSKTYGGSGSQSIYSVLQTPDGGYLLGASTNSNDFDVSVNYGNYDMWAIRTDDTGKIIWQKSYGGNNADNFVSFTKSMEGGYLLIGASSSTDVANTTNHGALDAFAIKVDDNGVVEWNQMYGGSASETPCDIHQLSDSSYLAVSASNSSDGDVPVNYGANDAWLMRLGNKIINTGVSNLNKEFGIRVYPTMAQDIVTVEAAYDISKATVQLFDLSGKKISLPMTKTGRQFVLQTGSLASGMYFVNVRTGREERTFKIVIN